MGRHKYRPEVRRRVADLVRLGISEAEVSRLTGVPAGSVWRIARATPPPGRRAPATTVEIEARRALAKRLAEKRAKLAGGGK